MRDLALALVFALLVSGCGTGGTAPAESRPPQSSGGAPQPPDTPTRVDSPKVTDAPRIVFLGDSLTAGLGLPVDQSFPSLIRERLRSRGYDYEIVNAGVSGDTSAGGLRRLAWSLEGNVRVLVLALGANDGLRGLPPDDMEKNLRAILDAAKQRGITVVLAGMEAPPNNGPDYAKEFRNVYSDLAKAYDVRFVPFLLQGVAGNPSLNQGDGIHPNTKGAQIVADLVWAELEPLLERQDPKTLRP